MLIVSVDSLPIFSRISYTCTERGARSNLKYSEDKFFKKVENDCFSDTALIFQKSLFHCCNDRLLRVAAAKSAASHLNIC